MTFWSRLIAIAVNSLLIGLYGWVCYRLGQRDGRGRSEGA